MSKDIIVLTPNGRRAKVHCSADTNMLQILEDVCSKHGFQPSEYNLKHHNTILDLTSTIRFSNLPNKAMLEMVEAEKKRIECNVTVGLTLNDGERRTHDFPPNTSLFDLVSHLASKELETLSNPTICYMRQEVIGLQAMKEKTLHQLGLFGGRAVLRLLNKADEPKQANVSAIYKVPLKEEQQKTHDAPSTSKQHDVLSDQLQKIKEKIHLSADINAELKPDNKTSANKSVEESMNVEPSLSMEIDPPKEKCSRDKDSLTSSQIQTILERRLQIEDEVTFIGAQKAIAFMQPDHEDEVLEDLPDNFYDLTVEEVRSLYHELHKKRIELENKPLLTSTQKDTISEQSSTSEMTVYKHAVVRVQFPDRIVLQGVFEPSDTIQQVMSFIKLHLNKCDQPFLLFTTPLKETLDPRQKLLDAKFVPGVLIHFKWLNEDTSGPYLKSEIYSKKTASDAANILASKYRAPSKRKEDVAPSTSIRLATTSKTGKVPKWFKN